MYSYMCACVYVFIYFIAFIEMKPFLNTTYILLHSYAVYKGTMTGPLLQHINCP